MGCLAAQAIAHFKKGVGDFYLYPANTRNCDEEFIYTVYVGNVIENYKENSFMKDHEVNLTVEVSNGSVLYDGPVSRFEPEKFNEV